MTLNSKIIALQLPCCNITNNIIVGYSGGIDSHVLLHLLAQTSELHSKMTAVYIDHGLQTCAGDWATHCQRAAQALAIKFKVIKVNAVAAQGESPEEAARNARYQAFKDMLRQDDVLLFAQHRNDQLETVLLQLFRGAGLKGLAGMPANIAFGAGELCRPLLDVTQTEIQQYAQDHGLQWVEDPSNADTHFDRNYLRNDIIPLIQQRWPSVDKTVARVAGHCAEAQMLLSTSAIEKMLLIFDKSEQCLSIEGLLKYDEITQQWILREWLQYMGARMPTQKVMSAILSGVINAQPDANPVVLHGAHEIRRYRDGLYVLHQHNKPDLQQSIAWPKVAQSLLLPNNGILALKETEQGIAKKLWLQADVQIKYRQGGEKIALPKRVGRHSLKKLYQEAHIAPWRREQVPLVYIDGCLAAIAGFWLSADYYVDNEACVSLEWQPE
ncbi:MAG: tRNA(Ile)-lysidine synthase [Methyloprofundus sp.]|nr:MAG: tRNA(Ile)-lysidine synthase [Methyloprofundus sp.]